MKLKVGMHDTATNCESTRASVAARSAQPATSTLDPRRFGPASHLSQVLNRIQSCAFPFSLPHEPAQLARCPRSRALSLTHTISTLFDRPTSLVSPILFPPHPFTLQGTRPPRAFCADNHCPHPTTLVSRALPVLQIRTTDPSAPTPSLACFPHPARSSVVAVVKVIPPSPSISFHRPCHHELRLGANHSGLAPNSPFTLWFALLMLTCRSLVQSHRYRRCSKLPPCRCCLRGDPGSRLEVRNLPCPLHFSLLISIARDCSTKFPTSPSS